MDSVWRGALVVREKRRPRRGVLTDGNAVKLLRTSSGITQEKLAELAACDVKTVRKAERGQNLDAPVVHRIASALNVQLTVIGPFAARSRKAKEIAHMVIVNDWQQAFNDKNINALVGMFTEDGEFHSPGVPVVESAMTFRGREELARHFRSMFEHRETEPLTLTHHALQAVNNYVYLHGRARLRIKTSGAEREFEVLHAYRFERRKIAELWIHCDTLAIYRLTHPD